MKLSDKGRHVPPPVLNAPLQRLSEEIQSWPGIISATHWHFSRNGQVDGADFYRGEEELGHLHLDGEMHLATPPALTRALLGAGLAQPFPWANSDDWVLYRIRSEADARAMQSGCWPCLTTPSAARQKPNCSAGCRSSP